MKITIHGAGGGEVTPQCVAGADEAIAVIRAHFERWQQKNDAV